MFSVIGKILLTEKMIVIALRNRGQRQELKMKFKQRNGHVISFRVTDEEREQIHSQAQRGGLSVSQLVRKNLHILSSTQS